MSARPSADARPRAGPRTQCRGAIAQSYADRSSSSPTLLYFGSKKEPCAAGLALKLELLVAELAELEAPAAAAAAIGLRESLLDSLLSLMSIAPLKNAPSSITIRCVLTSPVKEQLRLSSTRSLDTIFPVTRPWTMMSRAVMVAWILPLGPITNL